MALDFNFKTYTLVTVVIGAIIAVQIVAGQGSLGVILTLSIINAFIAALFSMGLKYEPGQAVAYIWFVPLFITSAYVLGMVLS